MKYLLLLTLNPDLFETFSQEERDAIFTGHDELIKLLRETGEMVSFVALADPTNTKTVRVRDEQAVVTDGPYVEAKEFLAGYYMVECETPERAAELAALIPDAKFQPIEVRPVMQSGGMEM